MSSLSQQALSALALPRHRQAALGLAAAAIILLVAAPHGRFWVFAPLLLLGPGYLIERALPLELPFLARPALWVGGSLAIIPLVYLWLTAAGLAVPPWLINLALAGLAAGVFWRCWRHPQTAAGRARQSRGDAGPALPPRSILILLGLALVMTAWTRVEHISGLVFPPWVDSVHHATIVQVIFEQGKVPYSLRPYLPIDNFAYHWGYHAIAATIMRAAGLSLPMAMLWVGQVLGVLQVVTLAGCVATIWDRPLAGVVAALTVGFLSIMPAYFLSWGRYTLLTGLTLAPVAMMVAWHAPRFTGRRWVVWLTLLMGGLLPIHFVAASFAILWIAAAWLCNAAWERSRWRILAWLAVAGGLAILLVGPWLGVLAGQTVQAVGPARLEGDDYNTYKLASGLYWTLNNRFLTIVAIGCAMFCFRRRWRPALAVVVWSALVALLANPVLVGLPYLSFFNNNIVALAIFIPIGLLLGGGAAAFDEMLARWLAEHRSAAATRGWRAIRTVGLGLFILWQGLTFRAVINDGTLIAWPADEAAIAWAAANTPADARFVINTEGWMRNVSRGSDGGWWLLPYAGRQVSTPPSIYIYGSRNYALAVQEETNWLRDGKEPGADQLADWMRLHGYQYAYATSKVRSQEQGKDPVLYMLNIEKLAASPRFREVYHGDGVSIFELADSH